jgi:ABC-type amino acid transport system permease subunit
MDRVIWVLLFIIAVVALGVWGAIKLTLWVLLIALVIGLILGLLGRRLLSRA